LRWESFAEALRACARVRPQVATRYSSTAKPELGEAATERRRWGHRVGEAEEEERRRRRMQRWRRNMA
jgi:hypothetical protein